MMSSYYEFYLFAAEFESQRAAELFVFEQWEPEPDSAASEAEYLLWEDRNPTWELSSELEFYLDSDFIELASVNDVEYVHTLIAMPAEKLSMSKKISPRHTHLVIIGKSAIYGDRRNANKDGQVIRTPESTKKLFFIGSFNAGI